MSVSITAYRAAIGLFCNCVRDKGVFKIPKHHFSKFSFDDIKAKASVNLIQRNVRMHERKRRADNILCQSAIALSIVIQVITLMANDIHLNPGPGTYNRLSICHTNIQSVRNKMVNINADLASKFDIITLSETWLKQFDDNRSLQLQGYQLVHRKDRSTGTEGYGGVLAWVANSIICKRRKDLETDELEAMWLELRPMIQKFFSLRCI